MWLNFAGGVLISASMVLVINAIVSTLDIPRPAKLAVAAVVGLWIGVQVSLASAGLLGIEIAPRFPLLGLMFLLAPLLVAVLAIVWPTARTALIGLPQPLLIGLNATRIVGIFFVLLAVEGRMAGPFPHLAGWGDVIVGVLAVPLVVLVVRNRANPLALWVWNIFGALDLLLALALGALSFSGGGALIPVVVGGAEIESLPWALIPTVLVPAYLVIHGIIFAQLIVASRRRGQMAAVVA